MTLKLETGTEQPDAQRFYEREGYEEIPLFGGLITTGISWRGIFLVNLPIGIVAIVISLWLRDEPLPAGGAKVDWPGVGTLTAGLFCLVYALIRDGGWFYVAAGVLLVAFVVVESQVRSPMFDLSLLRIPTFVGGSIAAFAMNASLFAMFLYIVLYLQNDLHYSALGAGTRLLVTSAGAVVAATVSGR
ncbi:MFS transporter, partial [Kibdelosporangium lantanae]